MPDFLQNSNDRLWHLPLYCFLISPQYRQYSYAGYDQYKRDHKCNPICKRSRPGDAGNPHYIVEQQHKQNIKAAFAQQRKEQRLHLFTDCLKDRNDHKIDSGCRAGKAYDLQKSLSVMDGFRIRNKSSCDRCGWEIEYDRSADSHDQAVKEGCLNGLFHSLYIAGAEIVSDQRERSLCHPLGYGIGQQIDFFLRYPYRQLLCWNILQRYD